MIVIGGLLFISLILIGAGIWFIINTEGYTKTITAKIVDKECPNSGDIVGPSAAPSTVSGDTECKSVYTFTVGDTTYTGKSENFIDSKTIDISYNLSDPNLNRIGDPDIEYLGPVMIGFGILVFGSAFFIKV